MEEGDDWRAQEELKTAGFAILTRTNTQVDPAPSGRGVPV